MNCEKCKGLLWECLAGELTKEDNEVVAEHLKSCATCQEEGEQLQRIMDSLKTLPEEELPQGYHEELMAKLAGEQKKPPFIVPNKPRYRWKQFSLLAAAIVLVAAIGGVQGVLNLRGSRGEIAQELTDDNDDEFGNDVMMKYSENFKEDNTDSTDEALMQIKNQSSQQENTVKQEKTTVQETTSKGEPKSKEILPEEVSRSALGDTGAVLQEGVSQDTETLMDNGQEESVSQFAEGAPRNIMMLQNDNEEESAVQHQVILSVENKEGVIDSISNLATSLDGYEAERSLEDNISIFIPPDKTEDFMEGLKDLGETRYLQDDSTKTDMVRFDVTIEAK